MSEWVGRHAEHTRDIPDKLVHHSTHEIGEAVLVSPIFPRGDGYSPGTVSLVVRQRVVVRVLQLNPV